VRFSFIKVIDMRAPLDASGPSCTSELDGKLFRNESCSS